MREEIPFSRLGIPSEHRGLLDPSAPLAGRLAAARGLIPTSPEVSIAMAFVLQGDPEAEVQEAAVQTLRSLPVAMVCNALHERTHPKIMECLVDLRAEPELDDKVGMMRMANDRTVRLIARRAGPGLCEKLALNHERMLMTPEVYVDLFNNPNTAERDLQSAEGFLRMEHILPPVPAVRPGAAAAAEDTADEAARELELDLEAEIMAAIAGEQSPALLASQQTNLRTFDVDALKVDLGGFEFTFSDDTDELSWILTEEREDRANVDEIRSMEALIRDMSPGKKIKLAYLGNRESRAILLRDSNKMVAAAVVKSGRMSDGEGLAAANNRNLAADVVREVASNREWVRKYPFQVALVNNPKCPPAMAMTFIRTLNRNDLQALTRNRNIAGAINQAAIRLYREKFKLG